MVRIDNVLVSEDIFEVKFLCDVLACRGECCVEGDAGAPLTPEEISILEDYRQELLPFLTEQGARTIKSQGAFDFDMHSEFVTPLVRGLECAYVNYGEHVAYCAIEKAYEEGKIPLRKPVSCHLYPLRISHVGEYEAINYHKWPICKPALKKGKKEGLPLYRFLKDSLVRRYGIAWYKKLEKTASERE